ncbi:MAG: DUF924 family protein [Myxococcales bacterium]|nr:DUF924 family protein [Myxococcales bacterium]MCB9642679.1 DUF924 family protein [Myxococcales bacterium]
MTASETSPKEPSIPKQTYLFGRTLPTGQLGKDADQVLRFWFGEQSDPQAHDYTPPSELWFRAGPAIDAEIQSRFQPLVEAAAQSKLDALRHTAHGCLALVLLLDQFPRHIHRGHAAMFQYDDIAQEIALYAIHHEMDQHVAPAERVFFYFALEHAEDIEMVRQAVAYKTRLVEDSPPAQRKRFKRMLRAGQQHVEILEAFGRYPYRNALLGRTTTPEETAFLETKRYGFMRSVQTQDKQQTSESTSEPSNPANLSQPDKQQVQEDVLTKQPDVLLPQASKSPSNGQEATPLKLLVLHSFRQNARIMRARTRKLRRALEGTAEIIYANAPLPYNPKGEVRNAVLAAFGRLQDTEHQRCWWNADEDNSVYEGVELSFAYIKQMDELYGPFDGILGFSQGGAFTGLAAAMAEQLGLSMRFVICISGFPSRAQAHQGLLQPHSIALPSLHIVGANDILVDPERTLALAECFQDPVIVQHSGGHFVPDRWPLEDIKIFLQKFQILPTPSSAWETSWPQLAETTPEVAAYHQALQQGLASSLPANLSADDVFAIARHLEQHHESRDPAYRYLVALWLYAQETQQPEESALQEAFRMLPYELGWSWMNDLAFEAAQTRVALEEQGTSEGIHPWVEPLQALHQHLVTLYAKQLTEDKEILEQNLSIDESDPHTLESLTWPSDCAHYAPKRRSAVDKLCHLACDIALALLPLPTEDSMSQPWTPEGLKKAKGYRYMEYRHTVRDLRKALDHLMLDFADRQRNERIKQLYEQSRSRTNPEQEPIPAPILHPAPEPVLPCANEELEPLLDWLNNDSPVAEMLQFTRGTLLPDGRLDLCKQVVGPEGIGPLLGAMQHSSRVKRLLLGNNIVGDGGARQIAEYIRSGRSQLDCWYIAGNEITAEGLQAVTEAIAEDPQVRHLWLKRNPLRPEGMIPLSNLLKQHQHLEVLDLLNCAVFDEGIQNLEEGWCANRSLRHLYLDANALTPKSAPIIARCLEQGPPLRTLFLSCNRLGDEGVRLLAPALASNTSLERLSLASNRLTPKAAEILVEALAEHPTLLFLDLGYMRGTGAVGEAGNFLGDEGAKIIAKLLQKNRTLRSLDLLHNDIGQAGLQPLCDALRENTQLIRLQFTQFSKAHNEYTREEIKQLLARNEALIENKQPIEDSVLLPLHLQEIHSVYRTRV